MQTDGRIKRIAIVGGHGGEQYKQKEQ